MRTLNHLTAYHVGPRRLRRGPVASVDDPRSAESKNWLSYASTGADPGATAQATGVGKTTTRAVDCKT